MYADVSAPTECAFNVQVPTKPCGSFFVDLPDIATGSPPFIYFVTLDWAGGDTCLSVGVDADGADDSGLQLHARAVWAA